MHCAKVKNGSLGGVFSRRAAWNPQSAAVAWAGLGLLAVLSLAAGFRPY